VKKRVSARRISTVVGTLGELTRTVDLSAPAPQPTGGVDPKAKYGATKPSVAWVPPINSITAAFAAEDGAKKYGAYNYRRGHAVEVMTYLHAAERHLKCFIDGEDFASDSGVPNLDGVTMCVGIVQDVLANGVGVDNRPPPGKASQVLDAGKLWKQAVANGENPVLAAKRILGPVLYPHRYPAPKGTFE
jgi:hypothetical protein